MAVRLLIVEPDRALLDTYRAYFVRLGLDVTTATNGEQGRESFLEHHQDALLLEPVLPRGDSALLLGTIASQTDQRPLPVVVASRRTWVELGFPIYGYHVKPLLLSTLLESILVAARQPSGRRKEA